MNRRTEQVTMTLRPHHGEPSVIGELPTDGLHILVLVVGFAISFIVAYAVVAWFMRWVRTRGVTVSPFTGFTRAFVLWWAERVVG